MPESRLHLTMQGNWLACDDASCTLPFHLADITVEGIEELPSAIFYQLLEAADPPSDISSEGTKYWRNIYGRLDRGYDLPAVVYPDGTMEWWQDAQPHRDRDLPAAITSGGERIWYQRGQVAREGGRPAVLREDGTIEWWENGTRHHFTTPEGKMVLQSDY